MNAIKDFTNYMESVGFKPEKCHNDLEYHVNTIYGLVKASVYRGDFTKDGKKPLKKHHNYVEIYFHCLEFDKALEYLKKVKNQKYPSNGKINITFHGGESEIGNWVSCFEILKFELNQIILKKDILITS